MSFLRKRRHQAHAARAIPSGDVDLGDFRRLWAQCSGFHAREPQRILSQIFSSANDAPLHGKTNKMEFPVEMLLHPDGIRGAMLGAADAHGEYAVACGLVLSAILGFFFDFDGDLDYHSAAGLTYAACISWSTFLLCRGVVRAALFRGQMTYTSRDVDFFVFVHKCYNFETGFHNASTLFCLTESLPLLVAAAFIKFHATAVEEEDELWYFWPGWVCVVALFLKVFYVPINLGDKHFDSRQTWLWAEGRHLVHHGMQWPMLPDSILFKPVVFLQLKLNDVLVETARRCGVYTYEPSKPWGKLDALDEDDDIFEVEALKEEFAYRTHVAIALANYALENKKGVQHRVAEIPEYVCDELREIMENLPEIHIPKRSKQMPLPVTQTLLSYSYEPEAADQPGSGVSAPGGSTDGVRGSGAGGDSYSNMFVANPVSGGRELAAV